MKQETPLVSIKCTVYNHEPYLRKCLDGFVMQQTDFRFEAIVHDDASTDGSAAIIREYAEKYPDIIKPIYETENQYSKHDGSLRRIMNEACKGKYIAICEGDDYWTDPLKLQKQVSFLEENPDFSMCCHGAKNENQNGLVWYTARVEDSCMSIEEIIEGGGGGIIPTMSIVYRSTLTNGLYAFNDGLSIGDYPLNIYCALSGKVMFFRNVMGVHTLGADCSWHVQVMNNREKYDTFLSELFNWLNKIDIITNKTYHNSICYEKISLLMSVCSKTNNYSALRHFDGLNYYLSKKNVKDKIVLVLRIYYFNWLVNLLIKKR